MKDGYKGAQETKKTLKKLYTVRPCHDIRPWPNTYYKQEIMTENSSPENISFQETAQRFNLSGA